MAKENGKLTSEDQQPLFYEDAGLGLWQESDGAALGDSATKIAAMLSTAAQAIGNTAATVGTAAGNAAYTVGTAAIGTVKAGGTLAVAAATPVVNATTHLKDKVRTYGEPAPSNSARVFYHTTINGLLVDMQVPPELRKDIMANVDSAMTVKELTRTLNILKVLQKHGLKGEHANQFFRGAHFKIDDGGALFKELKELEGAEPRFSSHFKETRQEELGISAGRIIPEMLFLNTIDADGNECSHFQTEASPWRAVEGAGMDNYRPTLQTLQNAEHIPDSIIYFVAKKCSEMKGDTVCNRSNYGWSPYADDNPITSLNGSLPKVKVATPASTEALLDAPMPKSVATATTTAAVEQTPRIAPKK